MNKHFGKKLKELRREKNWTQNQLANIFHVSKTTICQWETLKQEPSLDDIVVASLLFDVTADYLLGIEDESGARITQTKYNIGTIKNSNINMK